jgi:transcriptional regulator with XRE-family HTH domain
VTGADVLLLVEARELCRTGSARRIREAAGLSRRELAAGCGVTESTITRWELRIRRPRGAPAVKYAKLLRTLASRQADQGTAPVERAAS